MTDDHDFPDFSEPVGSCADCGVNLYADDEDDELCPACSWLTAQNGSD